MMHMLNEILKKIKGSSKDALMEEAHMKENIRLK